MLKNAYECVIMRAYADAFAKWKNISENAKKIQPNERMNRIETKAQTNPGA